MYQFFMRKMYPGHYQNSLRRAILEKDIVTISTALANGADPSAMNAQGYTALCQAVLGEDLPVVAAITDHPRFVFKKNTLYALFRALETKQPELFLIILGKYGNGNISLDSVKYNNQTLYTMAMTLGYTEESKILLSLGAEAFHYDAYVQMLNHEYNFVIGAQQVKRSDIDYIMSECAKNSPAYINVNALNQLKKFLTLATMKEYDIISRPEVMIGLEYWKTVFQCCPLQENDPDKIDKWLLQSVIAFMLAAKGQFGSDHTYENSAFYSLYDCSRSKLDWHGCRDTRDFLREEARILCAINGFTGRVREYTPFEDQPYHKEVDQSRFKTKLSSST